jgi:hypothetical protein
MLCLLDLLRALSSRGGRTIPEGPFRLETAALGALPVINDFLSRLEIEARLARWVPESDASVRLAPAKALGAALRCLCLRHEPGPERTRLRRARQRCSLLYLRPRWTERVRPGPGCRARPIALVAGRRSEWPCVRACSGVGQPPPSTIGPTGASAAGRPPARSPRRRPRAGAVDARSGSRGRPCRT